MNLLVIDHHPLFGIGLAHALAAAGGDIATRSARTLDEGLATAAAWPTLEVAMIDAELDGQGGLTALQAFRALFPRVACVVVASCTDPAAREQARAAGAAGWLPKSLSFEALVANLQRIGHGDKVFEGAAVPPPAMAAQTTVRQREVLSLIARGLPNKRIAGELGIAERTVKLHVTALLGAIGARNRTHLLVVARDKGLLR